jgi:hypothetical protein
MSDTRRSLFRAASLALSVSALIMFAAVIPGATASASPQLTNGFNVWNLTGSPMTLTNVVGSKCEVACNGDGSVIDGAPAIGSVLQPGQVQHFEVTYYIGADGVVQVIYNSGVRFYFVSAPISGGYFPTNYAGHGNLQLCPSTIRCKFNSSQKAAGATFLDPPGTVHTIPAGQGQAQAQVLKQLCDQTTAAVCDLKPSGKQEMVAGQPTPDADPWDNNTQDDVERTFEVSDTASVSDSLGFSYSAEFEATVFGLKIKNTITASYKHEWSTSHTVKDSVTFTIRPGYTGWVTGAPNYYRDYVDFSITMGNTTWHLPGVYFDVPVTTAGSSVHWATWTQKIGGGPVVGPGTPSKVSPA